MLNKLIENKWSITFISIYIISVVIGFIIGYDIVKDYHIHLGLKCCAALLSGLLSGTIIILATIIYEMIKENI